VIERGDRRFAMVGPDGRPGEADQGGSDESDGDEAHDDLL
jgi:hypothetical protein